MDHLLFFNILPGPQTALYAAAKYCRLIIKIRGMIKTWRHLAKNKTYALINLFGLTLGLSVCIYIFLYVQHELSYDRYLPGYNEIVRIQPDVSSGEDHQEWATTEGFIAPALTAMYP